MAPQRPHQQQHADRSAVGRSLPAVSFSRDGNSIFFIKDEKTEKGVYSLYRAPVLGGNPERIVHDIGSASSFSPDRARFVFMRYKRNEGEGDLMIANADGSGRKILVQAKYPRVSTGLVSGGKMIVAAEFIAERSRGIGARYF